MDILPYDSVREILWRVPIKSLIQCRSVCQLWRELIHCPYFSRVYTSRSLSQKPGLMLHTFVAKDPDGFFFHSQFLFVDRRNSPIGTRSLDKFTIPFEDEYYLTASCNGLLCLVLRNDILSRFVCNPFLGKFVNLPDHKRPSKRLINIALDFGFCRETHSYKIIEVSKWGVEFGQINHEYIFEIFVLKLGDDFWKNIELEGQLLIEKSGFASNVNGALHWVHESSAASLTVFNLVDDTFKEMAGPVTVTGKFSTRVIGNCLGIVNIYNGVIDIWIMKEYWVSWEKHIVVRLSEIADVMEDFRVIEYREEDREMVILYNNRYLFTLNTLENKFNRMNIEPNWYEVVLHYDTLVLNMGLQVLM